MKQILIETPKIFKTIKLNIDVYNVKQTQNTSKIEKMLVKLTNTMKELSNLLKKRDSLKKQIRTVMDLKAMSNAKFTNEQMEQYKNHVIDTEFLTKELDEKMIKLSNSNGMKFAQNEIISSEMNGKYVFAILKKANNEQIEIISILKKIIDIEENILATLQMQNIFDLLSKTENGYEFA